MGIIKKFPKHRTPLKDLTLLYEYLTPLVYSDESGLLAKALVESLSTIGLPFEHVVPVITEGRVLALLILCNNVCWNHCSLTVGTTILCSVVLAFCQVF